MISKWNPNKTRRSGDTYPDFQSRMSFRFAINSMSYPGARCHICPTMQDSARLIHAKFRHDGI